jgi:hypothetical protein
LIISDVPMQVVFHIFLAWKKTYRHSQGSDVRRGQVLV